MDKYTLFLLQENKNIEITNLISKLNWSDSLDTLGTQLAFSSVRNNDDENFSGYDLIEIGDKLLLKNGSEEIFRGIITDVSWNRYNKGITAFDYAIYLNKSKVIKQFHNISASQAIKSLVSQFSIPIGNIENISTKISKIYKDKTVAEIISDILKQSEYASGVKYRIEMLKGRFYIEKYKEIDIEPKFDDSIQSFNILDAIGNINKTESIQDMKNSILVSSNNEKSSRILKTAKDQTSINRYGLLQDVVTLDSKDSSKSYQVAQNRLKEGNKIKENISLNLLGSDLLRSGRVVTIKNNNFSMDGKFLIKSSSHTYNNGIHKCDITVEEIK